MYAPSTQLRPYAPADSPQLHLPPRGRSGFTLLEVLIAMVILGIGLMSVASLSVVAARAVVGGEVRSEFAMHAAEDLEDALARIYNGWIPESRCVTLPPFSDKVSRTVNVSNPRLAVVTVTVSPGPQRTIPLGSFTVTRSAYVPQDQDLMGSANGSPCSP